MAPTPARWLRGDVTPLHVAEENENPAVIAALVDGGADPDARAAGGRTALHVAAAWNPNPEVVAALLDAGAAADARDAAGELPLDHAKRNRAIRASEAYRRLVRAGEDVPYPLPGPARDSSRAQAKGVILDFETWPPGAEETAPLVRKLRNAGLEPGKAMALFKSWVFAWDELHESRFAENICFELALDKRVSSLFTSCTPDVVLHPPRPVAN